MSKKDNKRVKTRKKSRVKLVWLIMIARHDLLRGGLLDESGWQEVRKRSAELRTRDAGR